MTIAEQVMAHAVSHQNDAPIWFDIMECYELSEMEDTLRDFGITTFAGAKKHFLRINEVLEDRMADAAHYRDEAVGYEG